MGFYEDRILPHLVHLSMRNRHIVPYRERIIAAAEGRVLEIGIGSGLNLPFYRPHAAEILGLEPSRRLIAMAQHATSGTSNTVTFIEGSAEAIPLDKGSIDTVVTTWTLCTIPQAVAALEEARRVLKPTGCLLFVEHGMAPEESVRKWQNRLTPLWKRIGGGCHLNRPIRTLIESAGFNITSIETAYAKGPRPLAFFYEGSARP